MKKDASKGVSSETTEENDPQNRKKGIKLNVKEGRLMDDEKIKASEGNPSLYL